MNRLITPAGIQYSTVDTHGDTTVLVLPNGIVETVWFGDDDSQRHVSRSLPETADSIHRRHIAEDRA